MFTERNKRKYLIPLFDEAADIAIETGANVPKLVEHGGQLLAEGQVEESRQIERENVEHFTAVGGKKALKSPAAFAAEGMHPAARKTQRGERGEHALGAGAAGLREADGDLRHVDVTQLVEPRGHVVAEATGVSREIKAGVGSVAAMRGRSWAIHWPLVYHSTRGVQRRIAVRRSSGD